MSTESMICARNYEGTEQLRKTYQIDKPFLDEKTNGLSYAAKYMKGSPYCWQITLSADECERSALAMDAVQRLQICDTFYVVDKEMDRWMKLNY